MGFVNLVISFVPHVESVRVNYMTEYIVHWERKKVRS